MDLDIEANIVSKIIIPRKRERLLYLLSKPKKRNDYVWSFHTSEYLKENILVEIPGDDQYSEKIYEQMKSLGASDTCYAISGLSDIDGKEGKLSDFLDKVVGFTIETVLYCQNTNVGYFEGGHSKDRYILRVK